MKTLESQTLKPNPSVNTDLAHKAEQGRLPPRWATVMRLVFSLTVLCVFSATLGAAPVETTINECWEGNDHTGLSRCVNQRAGVARSELETMENSVRKAITKSNEDVSYLRPVKEKFEASVQSYRTYRREQCQLRAVLAAIGNGAAENEKTCEAELDVKRTEELKAGIWWLTK